MHVASVEFYDVNALGSEFTLSAVSKGLSLTTMANIQDLPVELFLDNLLFRLAIKELLHLSATNKVGGESRPRSSALCIH